MSCTVPRKSPCGELLVETLLPAFSRSSYEISVSLGGLPVLLPKITLLKECARTEYISCDNNQKSLVRCELNGCGYLQTEPKGQKLEWSPPIQGYNEMCYEITKAVIVWVWFQVHAAQEAFFGSRPCQVTGMPQAPSQDAFSKAGIPQSTLNPHLCQQSFALKALLWNVYVDRCWRDWEGFLGGGLLQDYHLSVCSPSSPSLLQCQTFWDSLIKPFFFPFSFFFQSLIWKNGSKLSFLGWERQVKCTVLVGERLIVELAIDCVSRHQL